MAALRKIALMHKFFGHAAGFCGNCSNYSAYEYRGRIYRKCALYGETHSEATDWKRSFPACGRFNTPMAETERPVVRAVRGERAKDEGIEGQMAL